MSGNPSPLTKQETDQRVIRDEQRVSRMLDVLQDPECREIMTKTAEQSLTATEISTQCEIALSTAYRKLDQLVAAGILKERIRLSLQQGQRSEYSLHIGAIEVAVTGEDGLVVRVAAD